MESRKMVLINLCAGKKWRCRYREPTYGPGRGRGKRLRYLSLWLLALWFTAPGSALSL